MAEYQNNVIETQPTGPEDEGGRNWLRLIGVLLAVIIIAFLLLFAARAVYRAVTDDGQQQPATTQNGEDEQAGAPVENGQPQPIPREGDGAGNLGQNGNRPNQAPVTGDRLPSSGPAHAVAVFAGSSLAGAGIHYIVSRRKKL